MRRWNTLPAHITEDEFAAIVADSETLYEVSRRTRLLREALPPLINEHCPNADLDEWSARDLVGRGEKL